MTLSGILNLDKPSAVTSHDVVAEVRRMVLAHRPARGASAGRLRVGHAGTLDPLATGVLVVCVGKATRLVEYLMQGTKTYRAVLQLGVATDTHDAEGEVVSRAPVQATREDVRRALAGFLGPIGQVPPMYSAIKHQGTPLYELARRGIEVERAPRQVQIHDLSLEEWAPSHADRGPQCTIRVVCSSGTYIRALARDIGGRLGCGAHLVSLTRLASGDFALEEAISLEQLALAVSEGRLAAVMYPPDAAVAHWPALTLDQEAAQHIVHGRPVPGVGPEQGGWARVYSPEGDFLAVAQWNPNEGYWQPRKVFV
jgi:tRNA pseudouridine55 synthase